MVYKVIEGFYDLQDNTGDGYHEYKPGDTYPRDGFETTPERIAELSGSDNKRGSALIEGEILVAPGPAKKRPRKK